jgi:hypothetical protein
MISSQCDELRERATALRQGRWADGEDDATMMEQAADTIWELREMAQKANDENAKLRYKVHVLEGGNKWLQILNNSLKANNARLRDFVYDMWSDMNVYYTQHESPNSSDMDFYRDRMRELGIEVEE